MSGDNSRQNQIEELQQRALVLLRQRQLAVLKGFVKNYSKNDLAQLLKLLEPKYRLTLFRLLSPERAQVVFSLLDFPEQNELLGMFSNEEAGQVIASLAPDDRTALLEDLPAEVTQKLLKKLEPEELDVARRLLGYPLDSVGRLMTPRFITCRPSWNAGRALKHLRLLGNEAETIKTIYITENNKLLGKLTIKQLMGAGDSDQLKDIMNRNIQAVSPYADREAAVQMLQGSSEYTLPVVSTQGRLLGIVTLDDILEVARDETTEDIQRLGGGEPLDAPYWDTEMLTVVYKRIGWLLLLFVGGTLTSTVIGHFEQQLEAVLVLAFFIPLLIDTGGNAGSQAVSTIIRAISTGEIGWGDSPRVIAKETLVGLLMGAMMGIAGYIFARGLWGTGGEVALVIGLSLLAICTWSNLVAGFIPLLAARLGLDPTLMSVPLITTVVDATGLVIYFLIAAMIL